MPSPIEELRRERLKKLDKIRALGFDPYPAASSRTHKISQAREAKVTTKVAVAGRIMAWREHGKILFADLVDGTEKIQLLFRQDTLPPEKFELAALLDIGDFIEASGATFKTKAGELTVEVEDLKLLTKSLRPLPGKSGLEDIEERYRKRYLDLIVNPEIKKTFEVRTKVATELRRYMDEHEFMEVDTPVLQPVYGGASARPFVTHHNALNSDFYLRISDELYLKRLIVGGFEKVYEIGHVFRNEGIDRAHNPEFTMMEFYWAYATYEDLMDYTQKMLTSVIKKVHGSLKVTHQGDVLDFTSPWPRKTYRDLLKAETGIDINDADTEAKLLAEVKKKGLRINLKGVVGYGALCDQLYKDIIRVKIIQPTYVTDYPAAMIALAKRKVEDSSKIASFQLLVKGFELIKAYNELNDPIDQKDRWLEEEKLGKKGLGEHMVMDEDYIEALEYGMPPTAGWGLGIDRFVSILTDTPSIKDTILFPTLRPR